MSSSGHALKNTLSDQFGDRFEIIDVLGRGGVGVVYRAVDRVRRTEVALKTLHRLTGSSLYRFKREFRSLADIDHPNLVTLYELLSTGATWFFTMELVRGADFLQAVRPHVTHAGPATMTPSAGAGDGDGDVTVTGTGEVGSGDVPYTELTAEIAGATGDAAATSSYRDAIIAGRIDIGRLRRSLEQLATGVRALHASGKLHLDLKPSNVLVENNGRIVVCDFGLVRDRGEDTKSSRRGAGTPAYMSPEQAAGLPLGPASDWYSIGVMIYESLTGHLPFEGTAEQMMHTKQLTDPLPPRHWLPELDEAWNQLCVSLLRRDPLERGSVATALSESTTMRRRRAISDVPAGISFVGRRAELDALRAAFDAASAGRTLGALVRGRSGIGKTALVEHFLADLQRGGEALILRARCYQRETVPYKALDALVDAVVDELTRRPAEELDALLPTELGSLGRLFPVVERIAGAGRPAPRDHQELRARGFAALRDLFAALGRERPLVLFIDDLQWGDIDSAPLFAELLAAPSDAAILVLATFRDESFHDSALLQTLAQMAKRTAAGTVRTVRIGPLEPNDARLLAEGMLSTTDPALTESLIRDADGHPFLLAELARDWDGGIASGIDEVINRRVRALPADTQALLTTAAIAGRPVPVAVLARAAGVKDEAAALASLLTRRLIRTHAGHDGVELLEPFHDRIRETVTAQLDEEQTRRAHRRLARTLESVLTRDVHSLVEHWMGAGMPQRAGEYAVLAARQASDAAAFDRAAHQYRLALELLAPKGEQRRQLQTGLADMLACSGNLTEAAAMYEAAAIDAPPDATLELRRRAMEQIIRAGRLDEGIVMGRSLLAAVGMRMPASDRRALLSIIGSRLWLAVRGRRFKADSERLLAPSERWRMDVCWSVASSMNIVNPLIASALQQRFVRAALNSGDAVRAALAVSAEIGLSSTPGPAARASIEVLLQQAKELVERSGDVYARGIFGLSCAISAFLLADWQHCADCAAAAQEHLASHCAGARYEIDQVCNWRLAALVMRGQLGTLVREVPVLLEQAVERGDEYLANALRSWRTNLIWLALDDPARARSEASGVIAAAPATQSFHIYHYYWLHTLTQIDLYEGKTAAALERIHQAWPRFTRSVGMRVHTVRVEAWFLRARAATACASECTGVDREALLTEIDAAAKALIGEKQPWALALAALVRSGAATLRGQRDAAIAEAEAAVSGLDAAAMELHAAVARARLGTLRAAAPLVQEAQSWMRGQRIVAPERLVALYAPHAP